MSRLTEWTKYLNTNFRVGIQICQRDDAEWLGITSLDAGTYWAKGCYEPSTQCIKLVVECTPNTAHFKTLIHEFGHFLCHTGQISYKDNPWVKRYFRQVPKDWLLSYPRWAREEEIIVESLARWALDFETDGGVNKGFKDFLIKLGGAEPPF